VRNRECTSSLYGRTSKAKANLKKELNRFPSFRRWYQALACNTGFDM
jgi:hypothetical protein